MKKTKGLLLLIPVIALAVLPVGCVPDVEGLIRGRIEDTLGGLTSTFTLKVDGVTGLAISGEYMVWHADYHPETWVGFSSESYTVEGQVPQDHTVEGVAVGAVIQKRTEDDSLLKVEIWKDGRLVESSQTTDPWGVVFVTALP